MDTYLLSKQDKSTIYKVLGQGRYKNIKTGQEGEIKEEDLDKYFVLPVTLNYLVSQNPIFSKMIEELHLTIQK